MNRSTVLLLGALLLAGCTPAPTATPPQAEISAPTPTAAIVSAASTNTPVAPAATATPTAPAPSATPLPPTNTPPPTATPSPSATPTATATATQAAPALVVSAPVANVRTGPGTVYPVLGQARQGESYLVTGRSQAGDWWQVLEKGDATGWISASLVEANAAAASIAVAVNIPTPPAPTATPVVEATEPPVAAASCPAWYQAPQPGMGVLVIENFHTMDPINPVHVPERVEEIGTPNEWILPLQSGDEPGRLTLQLSPGRHTFKVEYPTTGRVMIGIDVVAGQVYVSPLVAPRVVFGMFGTAGMEGLEGVVYPLAPPPGC